MIGHFPFSRYDLIGMNIMDEAIVPIAILAGFLLISGRNIDSKVWSR